MACQMAATAVTLNDLEGHSPVAGLFKCNPSNICVAFARFELTVCSRSLCVLVWIERLQRKEQFMLETRKDTQGAFRKPTSIIGLDM